MDPNYLNPYGTLVQSNYSITNWQYSSGNVFGGGSQGTLLFGNVPANIQVDSLSTGSDRIRVIVQETGYGCFDTSNYISVRVGGPSAAFGVSQTACYRTPVLLTSYSTPDGSSIVSYRWSFGDGITQLDSLGTPITHLYAHPGTYFPSLTVTDAAGCSVSTPIDTITVTTGGPQANFSWNPTQVQPGTSTEFYNQTSGTYSSVLWHFSSDGAAYTAVDSLSRTYPATVIDTITLVAYGNQPGSCATDTLQKILRVAGVQASFVYAAAYIGATSCPPVQVNFNSETVGANQLTWNFGDGSSAENNPAPSHTYERPGTYYITLTATGGGGASMTVIDSFTIRAQVDTLSINSPRGCAPASLTFAAPGSRQAAYIWDFGDGTVTLNGDSSSSHKYGTPGIYHATLIVQDSLGCYTAIPLDSPVVIDTLHTQVLTAPAALCDSGAVLFQANIYSLSANEQRGSLSFQWASGTGNPTDTSSFPTPTFFYNQLGKYPATLTVRSALGCINQVTDTILVTRGSRGMITGPSDTCAGAVFSFQATDTTQGPLTWQWLFPNGKVYTTQQVQPVSLPAGQYTIRLVVGFMDCQDTTVANLRVRPLPVAAIDPADTIICRGASITLTAQGGVSYNWAPSPELSNGQSPKPMVAPLTTTRYVVTASDSIGCAAQDTALVQVAEPFPIEVPADTFLCRGDSIILPVTGAYTYRWIAGSPINDTQSAQPIVFPLVNTTYTVVGSDSAHCFSDTASVTIAVEPTPTMTVVPVPPFSGGSITLSVAGSPDISSWSWSPGTFLSCDNCQDPVATPTSSITYTITGQTAYGCQVSDTLSIQLFCKESNVQIPGAFSPNGDGVNDLFYPRGVGIREVTSFRIYGRWGNLVFERHHIPIGDTNNAWNGQVNGIDQPVGGYVYEIDVICDAGSGFSYRGTVMLMR